MTEEQGAERWLSRVVVALFALSMLGLVVTGANGPANPHLAPPGVVSTRSMPGFAEIAFTVRAAKQQSGAQLCGALADSQPQHQRGMMGRHDLGGYDAMVFRFGGDATVPFYNRDVPIGLSIAWYDAAGRFVKGADMPSCPNVDSCPLFGAGAPYRYAVEAPQGGLARIGVGPGSTLAVGGACPSA